MDEAFLSGPPASHRFPGHAEMTDYSTPSEPLPNGAPGNVLVRGPGLPEKRLWAGSWGRPSVGPARSLVCRWCQITDGEGGVLTANKVD